MTEQYKYEIINKLVETNGNKNHVALKLNCTKYCDANFTHFSELLSKSENISVSTSAIRALLLEQGILSPKATRATKKKAGLLLEEKKKKASCNKEVTKITESILLLEDAYPRRPRCSFFWRNDTDGCFYSSLVWNTQDTAAYCSLQCHRSYSRRLF